MYIFQQINFKLMTAAEYFDQTPKDHQGPIQALRKTILREYPGIEEAMDFKMPTYLFEGEQMFALASEMQHMALYIIPYRKLDSFRESLSDFDLGKSCIRFKTLGPEQLKKLQRIIAAVGTA